MKNFILLAFCLFLFSSLSYAYEDEATDYGSGVESYDQSQEYQPQEQEVESEPQMDRIEDVSMNAEEDTSYDYN